MDQTLTENQDREASPELLALIGSPIENLFDWLISLHGQSQSLLEKTKESHAYTTWMTLSFMKGDICSGEVKMAFMPQGFVIERKWNDSQYTNISFDLFDEKGKLIKNQAQFQGAVVSLDTPQLYDRVNPFINGFYQYLAQQYKLAGEDKINTPLVLAIEQFLRRVENEKLLPLSILQGAQDDTISDVFEKLTILESNPVLNWKERQVVIEQWYVRLKEKIKVKSRAHGRSQLLMSLIILKLQFIHFFKRIKMRPKNNLLGLLNYWTIERIIWFFKTVRNNLGYSIALAVYGPFTYYFITMPMNPHAMTAVGRVRNAYLEIKQDVVTHIEHWMSDQKAPVITTKGKPHMVQVQASAPQPTKPDESQPLFSQIIEVSAVTQNKPVMTPLLASDQGPTQLIPQYLNMPLTTEVDVVNQQSWQERMSRFKNMQIAYEENLEYAPRMGRLEQLETQYNFPMMVEASWEEVERYIQLIFKIRSQYPQLSAKFKQYLFNEVNRSQQLQLYLWDRMSRFILDQPYVMLDQDQEQQRNDYYVGRAFVFMEEMTQVLSWRYEKFNKPTGYEKIEKLAKFYREQRKELGNIFTNLKNNSDLFKQKELLSSQEFRSYMKRQWEILFLQNAKAEEASNNGLNMYIWSVRNTVWSLQSIYSHKREDLEILLARDQKGLLTNEELWRLNKLELLYETLVHNLTLEYVGIRHELKEKLGKDIEPYQREIVLSNLKEFILDRNKLLHKNNDDLKSLGSY